jgi:WhiB family transcriptional regulator, redox-sensing transcriptional regulator
MIDLRWHDRAACKGTDTALFYLKADDFPEVIKSLRIRCLTACPVLAECRKHALEFEDKGFWGGTTESERRRIRAREHIEKRSIRFAYLWKEGDK